MPSRRMFLRMLGQATVGTIAYDQLSFLVRQPHSVIHSEYPFTTTITVTGLQAQDRIAIYQMEQQVPVMVTEENGVLVGRTKVYVSSPKDRRVVARKTGLTPYPFESENILDGHEDLITRQMYSHIPQKGSQNILATLPEDAEFEFSDL